MANWSTTFLKYLGFERITNPRKYFYKLIWLGCISVCIPIILASVGYYQIAMSRMESYVQRESDSSLTLLIDRAERVLQEIEQQSLQLARDPAFQEAYAGSPNEDAVLNLQILNKMALTKNSNSFIDEIFLYNGSGPSVYSNEYGVVPLTEYKYKADIDRLLASKRPAQWTELGGRKGYITFVRTLPLIGYGGAKGILGFEVETSALSKFLETDTVILADGQDLTLVKLQEPFGADSKPDAELIRETAGLKGIATIKASDQTSGRFVAEGLDGMSAQYRFVKNVFSRTYISVIPQQAITAQLSWIGRVTVLLLVCFAGVGIVLTVITSRRAYSPIEQLIDHSRSLRAGGIEPKGSELDIIKGSLDYLSKEAEKLGSYLENVKPSLREKFLFQLLGGDYTRSETLLQDCLTYGIEVKGTNVVLIVEAGNIYKEKRFLPEEKGIVAFSLANVMQEMLADHSLQGYAVPYQGRGAALVQFKPDLAQDRMLNGVLEYAAAVTEAFKRYLMFEVTVGIGRFYAHIADAAVSFKEAESALQYRIFQDSEAILYIEEVELIKKQALLRYPREQEKAMIDSLEQGDIPAAILSFRQFSERLQSFKSYVFMFQSYHLLLSALIASLEKQGAHAVDVMEHNVFGHMGSKMTSQEISEWFEETLFPLYAWLTRDDREATAESAIELVCNYIDDNCGSDLSLVQCAELAEVSPSYLSRLFKKATGKSFLEYVVERKIEEAKRLLRDTDQSISEVAAAIGHSERNFIRIFQRYVQMNPSGYRARHR